MGNVNCMLAATSSTYGVQDAVRSLSQRWEPDLALDLLVQLDATGSTWAYRALSVGLDSSPSPAHIGLSLWANMIAMDWDIYMMGSPEDEENRWNDEHQQMVMVYPFALMQYPVTAALWDAVMENKLTAEPDMCPKTHVNWNEAQKFCNRANQLLGLYTDRPQATNNDRRLLRGGSWSYDSTDFLRAAARGDSLPDFRNLSFGFRAATDSYPFSFRLPYEAEWEYACRAGCKEARYGPLDEIAWHHDNSNGSCHPVGMKKPNAWGFHDMIGNAWEWCQDRWSRRALHGSHGNKDRLLRGGSWRYDTRYLRAAARYNYFPGSRIISLGFRAATGV